MRPNAPHNLSVEPVKELSDMGFLVILTAAPQQRIQFLSQLPSAKRDASLGSLAHLIHETPDGFLLRVRVQRTRTSSAADLGRGQPKLFSALDLVAEELESVSEVNDPRFLRMQFHAQLFENLARGFYRRAPP